MDITTTTSEPTSEADEQQAARVRAAIAGRSFAVLSTVSPAGFPHAAGVLYVPVGDDLWVHTTRTSRKARNIEAHGRVAVVVPVRKLPVGPPFTVQFQARAEIVAMDDPEVIDHVRSGAIKAISSHGELDLPDGCFVRIRPNGVVHSYGIGVSAIAIARDPLSNGPRSVDLR